jgi:hypothetical protein
MIEVVAIAAGVVSIFGVGFGFGKLSERRNWNKLIERGIIPKPRSNKR